MLKEHWSELIEKKLTGEISEEEEQDFLKIYNANPDFVKEFHSREEVDFLMREVVEEEFMKEIEAIPYDEVVKEDNVVSAIPVKKKAEAKVRSLKKYWIGIATTAAVIALFFIPNLFNNTSIDKVGGEYADFAYLNLYSGNESELNRISEELEKENQSLEVINKMKQSLKQLINQGNILPEEKSHAIYLLAIAHFKLKEYTESKQIYDDFINNVNNQFDNLPRAIQVKNNIRWYRLITSAMLKDFESQEFKEDYSALEKTSKSKKLKQLKKELKRWY